MKNRCIIILSLISILILFLSCSYYNIEGEWLLNITYISQENSGTTEHYSLLFNKEGKVFKDHVLFGDYSRRANNRFKFFSKDRKIVFYAAFENKNNLTGEALHIPNDTIFANWTATRVRNTKK